MATEMFGRFLTWLLWYIRPFIKGLLRVSTRLCELQRICYGDLAGGPKAIAVENSLRDSRQKDIQAACQELDSMDELFRSAETERRAFDQFIAVVLRVKSIKRELHQSFPESLRVCLRQIWGYKKLCVDVERLRTTPFDSNSLEHETSLLELWSLLQPGVPLKSRKTRLWRNIGFQGDDPKTDFRGMGILGLHNLIYFAKEYNSAAKHILSHSHHPQHGYSFAIVGINLTYMAYKLLKDGYAKSHLFNAALKYTSGSTSSGAAGRPLITHFHHLYSYLFVEFDKFWIDSKPRDVMEFNRIRDLFENRVRTALEDPTTCFTVQVGVDTV